VDQTSEAAVQWSLSRRVKRLRGPSTTQITYGKNAP